MSKLLAHCALLAIALLLPASHPEAGTDAVCTSVDIELPDKVVLHGSRGDIRAQVTTGLGPGRYTIHYLPDRGHFVVSPAASIQSVVYVSLNNASDALGRRYEAYVDSMRDGVPLVIVAGAAAGTPASCKSCPGATRRARPMSNMSKPTRVRAPQATVASLTAEAKTQAWAGEVAQLASDKGEPLSATDVQRVLQRRGIAGAPVVTSEAVVRDERRREQWQALSSWEQKLWNEFLARHKGAIDVTSSPDGLSPDASVRFTMALTISYKYMDEGMRAAARALFTDSTFVTTTMVAIMAYLALWVAPEPLFSKAAAVVTTIGLVAMAGFAATEIIGVARAFQRLRRETKQARTLEGIEAAARHFGESIGGTGLRVLLALALIKGGKHLPKPPEIPAGLPGAPASANGAPAASLAVARDPAVIQVLADSTVKVLSAAMAMTHAGGGGGGTADSEASSGEPGKWEPVKENMPPRAKAYQEQVTGRSASEGYVVEGVAFDGYKDGKLIECKGPGYERFLTTEEKFQGWFRGKDGMLDQARRQLRAAKATGTPVEWHIAERRVARLLRKQFTEGGLLIKVVHTPSKL